MGPSEQAVPLSLPIHELQWITPLVCELEGFYGLKWLGAAAFRLQRGDLIKLSVVLLVVARQ